MDKKVTGKTPPESPEVVSLETTVFLLRTLLALLLATREADAHGQAYQLVLSLLPTLKHRHVQKQLGLGKVNGEELDRLVKRLASSSQNPEFAYLVLCFSKTQKIH